MQSTAIELVREALWLMLMLSAPPIVAATVVGLLIAVLQAATQIQEQTVQYLGKLIAVVACLLVTASLLAGSLFTYADSLFTGFPGLLR